MTQRLAIVLYVLVLGAPLGRAEETGTGEAGPTGATGAVAETAASPFEGFGAESKGGEGGREVFVTTLAADGPGSLVEALMLNEPRIVKFKVEGDIKLKGFVNVTRPFLTVDGTSAPGKGVTLRGGLLFNYKGDPENPGLKAHDIILKGIRIRGGYDNIALYQCSNVVIDHCSVGPAGDGSIDVCGGSKNVTISWCIFTKTNKANLVGYGATRVSVHHSIFYGTGQRNPQAQMPVLVDFRNLIVCNWSHYGTRLAGSNGNIMNCLYLHDRPENLKDALCSYNWNGPKAHVTGNVDSNGPLDGGGKNTSPEPLDVPPVTTWPVLEMTDRVLDGAGARPLDAQDQAAVDDIRPKWDALKGKLGG